MMQNENGTPHFAYYREDKGLSFTWNGRTANVLDVAYGGYGEPVFATLGLGFDPSTHRLPEAFARMQKVADRAADSFVIGFWEKAIARATLDGPARELPYCCAEGGYAKDGDGVVRCGTCWDDLASQQAYEANRCVRATYDVLECATHCDDFPDDAGRCLSAAAPALPDIPLAVAAPGFTDSVTAPGFTAPGFTEHPSQRFIRHLRSARYAEALAGGHVIRRAVARGDRLDNRRLAVAVQIYRAIRVEDCGNQPDVLPGPILSRGYAGG